MDKQIVAQGVHHAIWCATVAVEADTPTQQGERHRCNCGADAALAELSKPDEGEMAVTPPRKSVPLDVLQTWYREAKNGWPHAIMLAKLKSILPEIEVEE